MPPVSYKTPSTRWLSLCEFKGLIPRVTLRSPWALLCRAVGTGFRFISAFTDGLVLCTPSDFFKSVFQFSSIFCSVLAQTSKNHIVERQLENVYGSGFYRKLSNDLRQELPDAKGFSPTNLKYFKYFYELYHQEIANRQQAVDDLSLDELFSIPWGHHIQIINRCGGDVKKALFYVKKTIEFNWARSVLMNFLDTGLYEREGKAISNFQTALLLPQGNLAQEITKDPYNFNFLTLDKSYHENDLKKALLANITKFRL